MSTRRSAAPILVVGLGNPLMGDDGFGSAVVESLRSFDPPSNLQLAVAPDVLHLASLWCGQPRVWLVDAVVFGDSAGTIRRFDHEEVLSLPSVFGSAHYLPLGTGLRWLLHAEPSMGRTRFLLWGAEPHRVTPCSYLSRMVGAAAVRVAREILRAARMPTATSRAVTAHAAVNGPTTSNLGPSARSSDTPT